MPPRLRRYIIQIFQRISKKRTQRDLTQTSPVKDFHTKSFGNSFSKIMTKPARRLHKKKNQQLMKTGDPEYTKFR